MPKLFYFANIVALFLGGCMAPLLPNTLPLEPPEGTSAESAQPETPAITPVQPQTTVSPARQVAAPVVSAGLCRRMCRHLETLSSEPASENERSRCISLCQERCDPERVACVLKARGDADVARCAEALK